jgi:hypothetical protein
VAVKFIIFGKFTLDETLALIYVTLVLTLVVSLPLVFNIVASNPCDVELGDFVSTVATNGSIVVVGCAVNDANVGTTRMLETVGVNTT